VGTLVARKMPGSQVANNMPCRKDVLNLKIPARKKKVCTKVYSTVSGKVWGGKLGEQHVEDTLILSFTRIEIQMTGLPAHWLPAIFFSYAHTPKSLVIS
jgi:hypothetical protein